MTEHREAMEQAHRKVLAADKAIWDAKFEGEDPAPHEASLDEARGEYLAAQRMLVATGRAPATWEALIFHGREGILTDAHVARVREMTPEEKGRYREWVWEHATLVEPGAMTRVEERDSATASRLHEEARDTGRRLRGWVGASNDSVVIPISGAEREAILRECREAAEKREAAAERRAAEAEAALERKYAEAVRSGEPQVIETDMDECDDPREECSYDHISVYAMPDGSRKVVRTHTW